MSTKPYFCLYAHNLVVRGATRSAIYDLQRQTIIPIPSILHSILTHLKQYPWRETQRIFASRNEALFGQYMQFLLDRELGFFVSSPACFPALDLQWHSPHHIQNAVVSYAFRDYDLEDVLSQLDALHCRHLELQLNLGSHCWEDVLPFFQQLQTTGFLSVNVVLAYSAAGPSEQQLAELYQQCGKIQHILVHSAPYNRVGSAHPHNLAFVRTDVRTTKPRNRYVVSSEYFTEALRYNPYYNRKVCVSETGHVKNCLLRPEHFATVQTTRLATVLGDPAFQELWHAAADHTVGLRDSELRYAHFSADYLVRDTASGLYTHVPYLVSAQPVPQAVAA
ncbi:hypothetical protein KLP40_20020 [Hymenobacter sp. NST-14]|uniref:hypothetical protein n=1 Tax=Hymenobacter piscis TaxID=2839984 RepID=UPI001C024B1A|nr:hypothetical protein [Hymenobacter piscis]MBT9395462.1 hypothetical protein [Hymenobacter piscis]